MTGQRRTVPRLCKVRGMQKHMQVILGKLFGVEQTWPVYKLERELVGQLNWHIGSGEHTFKAYANDNSAV